MEILVDDPAPLIAAQPKAPAGTEAFKIQVNRRFMASFYFLPTRTRSFSVVFG